MKLSAIVPVYNEAATVETALRRLLKIRQVSEVIVVDDGSTDATPRLLKKIKSKKIQIVRQKNGGKGAAVRKGLELVSGDYVLIQDADLEYDPADIPALLEPVKQGKAEIVYGSRFLGPHMNLLFWHRLGNSLLNLLVNLLYNTTLSDMETCYKLVPTKVLRSLHLASRSFELEPEITCKLLRSGYRIFEVPISYVGRDFSQGKKITWIDGIHAAAEIVKWRILP